MPSARESGLLAYASFAKDPKAMIEQACFREPFSNPKAAFAVFFSWTSQKALF
jgi:hypothetical protein